MRHPPRQRPWPWRPVSYPSSGRSLPVPASSPAPRSSPFPTAPRPFRPRSASVPDDPSPGRPPPPPPRAAAASPASGVAESASGRRCGADGVRRDRAGGHGESGPRRCAHRLEPAPVAGAMDRAPAEQVRELPGCSRASGPVGPPPLEGRERWTAAGLCSAATSVALVTFWSVFVFMKRLPWSPLVFPT